VLKITLKELKDIGKAHPLKLYTVNDVTDEYGKAGEAKPLHRTTRGAPPGAAPLGAAATAAASDDVVDKGDEIPF
jgi:hypothetical protein